MKDKKMNLKIRMTVSQKSNGQTMSRLKLLIY